MGKASRWIRGLLGMKKDKENVETDSNHSDKKEKKRWSFVKSGRESSCALKDIPPANDNSSWLRSYIAESEKEQNKHAIAVAAATAAAADAAVAAAQAAVAVVRLTSQGRGGLFVGGREKFAAVKIQTVFRGYLARKALRALKGLVKLQALVRGYLVRKRAAATLHSMQALFRAQATMRARRSTHNNNDRRFHPSQRSTEINRSDLFHSKRLSASYEPCYNSFDESPKIVEIDTCGASKSRSRRISTACVPENFDDQYYHMMMPSPLPCPNPSRVRIHGSHQHPRDYDWGFIEEDYKFPTAQSTPRFAFANRGSNVPVTPSKSVCGDSFFGGYYGNCPGYMANTQSFNAKLRSHSAPKQRPEPEPVGPKKRLSLTEMMAARSSFSGVRMQRRSCSQVHEDFEL